MEQETFDLNFWEVELLDWGASLPSDNHWFIAESFADDLIDWMYQISDESGKEEWSLDEVKSLAKNQAGNETYNGSLLVEEFIDGIDDIINLDATEIETFSMDDLASIF